jgi:NAD(P)H-hydrate epimerase
MTTASSPAIVTEVPRLAPRAADAHKGTFGKVLVVAGSVGMSGAAVLAGTAALRGGAGLVHLAVAEPIAAIVAASQPCYTLTPLPADAQGRLALIGQPLLLQQAESASAVVAGPGLGQTDEVAALVQALVEQDARPLVLDADALNVLAGRVACLRARKRPFVLTPHPGEFARLAGSDTRAVQAARQELAVRFAGEHGGVVVLKGHGTIVTDGRRVFVNPTGNPGMATGGSGDVLAGLLGALLAGGMEAFDATVLGVYLHGLAGDLARDERGEASLIATDLLAHLGGAFRQHAAAR